MRSQHVIFKLNIMITEPLLYICFKATGSWFFFALYRMIRGIIHDYDTFLIKIGQQFLSKPFQKHPTTHLIVIVTFVNFSPLLIDSYTPGYSLLCQQNLAVYPVSIHVSSIYTKFKPCSLYALMRLKYAQRKSTMLYLSIKSFLLF